MTDRPTADIIADLREWVATGWTTKCDLHREAADRLAELDAGIENVRSLNESLLVAIQRRDAALPPCPTCGGNRMLEVRGAVGPMIRCPDCKDHPGKVSIEQLVALWNFVQTASDANLWSIEYLRSVKP